MSCSFVSNFASESSGFFASKKPTEKCGKPATETTEMIFFPRTFRGQGFFVDGFFGGRVKTSGFWRAFVSSFQISVSFSCFISSMESIFGDRNPKVLLRVDRLIIPFSHHPIIPSSHPMQVHLQLIQLICGDNSITICIHNLHNLLCPRRKDVGWNTT